jgi:hypothetical protein
MLRDFGVKETVRPANNVKMVGRMMEQDLAYVSFRVRVGVHPQSATRWISIIH